MLVIVVIMCAISVCVRVCVPLLCVRVCSDHRCYGFPLPTDLC